MSVFIDQSSPFHKNCFLSFCISPFSILQELFKKNYWSSNVLKNKKPGHNVSDWAGEVFFFPIWEGQFF